MGGGGGGLSGEGVKIKVGSLKLYICISVHGGSSVHGGRPLGFAMVLHQICSSVQLYLLFYYCL